MNPDYTIRLMTMDDAVDAAKLWNLVFGDDEQLVHAFFRLFAHQKGFGACAEKDGTITAAAYCPEDMHYVAPDGTAHPGAYLYAVATHPDHRKQGLAQAVCTLLKETAWKQGKEYIFTRPSEESLYDWYAEKIDAVPAMGCRILEFSLTRPVELPHKQLQPHAYLELRNKYLSGLPHVRQSMRWMEWEHALHRFYGGGFMAVGDTIADTYLDGKTLYVNELLPHLTPQQAKEVCEALMTATDTVSCRCTIHGTGHYVSVAANGCEIPTDNVWFGPCFG